MIWGRVWDNDGLPIGIPWDNDGLNHLEKIVAYAVPFHEFLNFNHNL